jgi:hypothetical protein
VDEGHAVAIEPARHAAAAASSATATNRYAGIAGLIVRGIIEIRIGCIAAATAIATAPVLIVTGKACGTAIALLKPDACHAESIPRVIAARNRPGQLAANAVRVASNSRVMAVRRERLRPCR